MNILSSFESAFCKVLLFLSLGFSAVNELDNEGNTADNAIDVFSWMGMVNLAIVLFTLSACDDYAPKNS